MLKNIYYFGNRKFCGDVFIPEKELVLNQENIGLNTDNSIFSWIKYIFLRRAPVAQMVVHPTSKQEVRGSIPEPVPMEIF